MRFLLIDKISELNPGVEARAVKNVALSEDYFADHFPSKPIMPGVLIIEGLAQLSGLMLEEGVRLEKGRNVKALMSMIEKAKFRSPVYPGDSLEYSVQIDSENEMGGKVKAFATAKGKKVMECTLLFSYHEFSNLHLEKRRQEVIDLWMAGSEDA